MTACRSSSIATLNGKPTLRKWESVAMCMRVASAVRSMRDQNILHAINIATYNMYTTYCCNFQS